MYRSMNDVLYKKLEKTPLEISLIFFPEEPNFFLGGTSYFRHDFITMHCQSQSNTKSQAQAGRHEQTAAKECQHHVEDDSEDE